MSEKSPFQDVWRKSLSHHYLRAVRSGADAAHTARTLLEDVGFTETELLLLYIEATATDKHPAFVVESLQALEAYHQQERAQHDVDCTCSRCKGG